MQTAFAQQIGGKLSQGREGDVYKLEVIFRVADLMKAENRAASDTVSGTGGVDPS